jgi:hypothetical protein
MYPTVVRHPLPVPLVIRREWLFTVFLLASYTTVLYKRHEYCYKKIGGRQYAYTAYRIGKKAVQRYLGLVNNPDVIARIAAIVILVGAETISDSFVN